MELGDATKRAEQIALALEPMCERVMICGSIRRKQPVVSDIDLVVIPKRDIEKDLFGNVIGHPVIPEFYTWVSQWEKVRGEPTGKYTSRIINGTKVEISMASQENWGNIVLIRTGNAEFSHMVMKRVLSLGFEQRGGMLYNGETVIPLTEEEHYFQILNLPYINPESRDKDAFR